MQKVTYYDDHTGAEITGMMICPSIRFAETGIAPSKEEYALIDKLGNLAFATLDNMTAYFVEKFGKEDEK